MKHICHIKGILRKVVCCATMPPPLPNILKLRYSPYSALNYVYEYDQNETSLSYMSDHLHADNVRLLDVTLGLGKTSEKIRTPFLWGHIIVALEMGQFWLENWLMADCYFEPWGCKETNITFARGKLEHKINFHNWNMRMTNKQNY